MKKAFENKNILCMSTQEWDGHWTPVQQVMARLAPRNRVLYIEPFHTPLSWLRKRHELRRQQRSEKVPQLREVQENLFVYRPGYPYFPFYWKFNFFMRLNQPIYKNEIRQLLKKMRMEKPWLWMFFTQGNAILDLPFEKIVYDCVDEWAAFHEDPVEAKNVAALDRQLCQASDLVFVGSKPLYKSKSPISRYTHIVNHAADIAHFNKACADETVVPGDIKAIPHPRIGFVGMVDTVRFDMDLIHRLAENPNYHIVIVGGFVNEADKLIQKKENIHLLGMKSIDDLPGYLKGMDVCMMPYRLNEATMNIYPLKLHEYLATGKPTVTSRIAAVEGLDELFYISDSTDHYIQLVAKALEEEDPGKVKQRLSYASHHDWAHHVSEKISVIEEQLL